ncbi:IclR family transcriptional regulator [Chloroflexota bacterium]
MCAVSSSIQSVEAALDVVESFLAADGGLFGVTEIARRAGLKKNRVWRILDTLSRRGYAQQDPRTGQYGLGPAFLVLGEAFRDRLDLRRLAQPLLSDLAAVTGDAAFLFVGSGAGAVCTEMRKGENTVQALARLGESIPLHIGASPKVLLAFMPEPRRTEALAQLDLTRYTPATITDRDELVGELDRIRSQGYCVAEDDYELGANAIGAPVRDHTGEVAAALSLSVPHIRYDRGRRERSVTLVLAAALQLSQAIGFVTEDTQR